MTRTISPGVVTVTQPAGGTPPAAGALPPARGAARGPGKSEAARGRREALSRRGGPGDRDPGRSLRSGGVANSNQLGSGLA